MPPSVRPSVRPSERPSVRPSVRHRCNSRPHRSTKWQSHTRHVAPWPQSWAAASLLLYPNERPSSSAGYCTRDSYSSRDAACPICTERDRPIQQGRGEWESNNSLSSILEGLPASLSRWFRPWESLHREVLTGWSGWWCKRSILILIRRPEGAGRGAFYSAGGTARRSFAIDLKRISKRERETLAFLGSVVEPSSARRRLIKK